MATKKNRFDTVNMDDSIGAEVDAATVKQVKPVEWKTMDTNFADTTKYNFQTNWSPTPESPSSRRRKIGDAHKTADAPGYWVHVRNNRDGIPYDVSVIEVDFTGPSPRWRYIVPTDNAEWRIIERLPAEGVYLFLY